MEKPRICASIVNKDLEAINAVTPLVALFEVRIDLIGDGWQDIAGQLEKPWLACNRIKTEGGNWQGSEARRKEELLKAVQLGADIVDVEMATPNLDRIVPMIKKESQCLISFHDMKATPPLDSLKKIVRRHLAAGADICKVITFANNAEDNLTILRLIPEFLDVRLVAFAMGQMGLPSRILSPLVGGDFTIASVFKGAESAPGQITVTELDDLYRMVKP